MIACMTINVVAISRLFLLPEQTALLLLFTGIYGFATFYKGWPVLIFVLFFSYACIMLGMSWCLEVSERSMHMLTQQLEAEVRIRRTAEEEARRAHQTALAAQQQALRSQAKAMAAKEAALLAKDQAQHAERAQSRFLAMMSHEIRTPLAGVLGFIDLLNETELDAEQAEYLANLSTSCTLLRVVSNDVLQFSKLQAGQIALDLRPTMVASAIHHCTNIFKANAASSNLLMNVTADPGVHHSYDVDEPRLQQMVSNLVSNALTFTKSGGIRVRISPEVLPDGHPGPRIAAQDTGVGVPLEVQGRLFRPFQQADERVSRSYGGTGLGPLIVKSFAVLMGGAAGVCSTPAEAPGGTFWFAVRATPSGAQQPLPASMAAPTQLQHPDMHILGIDDTPVNLKLMNAGIKGLGCRPTCINGGAQAVTWLQSPVLCGPPGPRADGRADARYGRVRGHQGHPQGPRRHPSHRTDSRRDGRDQDGP